MRGLSIVVALLLALASFRLVSTYHSRSTKAIAEANPPAGIPVELDTKDLKILNFYVAGGYPVRGEPFTLCYGVINAASVTLDPPVAQIAPSMSRCVEAMINRQATLTLTATAADGSVASRYFTLGVREPAPEFTFITISARKIKPGERFALCYGTKHATSVSMEPFAGLPLAIGPKRCYLWNPTGGPYTLIAESKAGADRVLLPFVVSR